MVSMINIGLPAQYQHISMRMYSKIIAQITVMPHRAASMPQSFFITPSAFDAESFSQAKPIFSCK